jgi:hypothetical protein
VVDVKSENSPKPGGENHKPAADPSEELAVAFVAKKSQDAGPHDTMLAGYRGIAYWLPPSPSRDRGHRHDGTLAGD